MLEVAIQKQLGQPGPALSVRFQLGAESAVVFGQSGAGKTSLLHMLAGLLAPDSGRITLEGVPLYDSERGISMPLRRRRIGLMAQKDCLFPHMSVSENIAYGLGRLGRVAARRRVQEVADLCGVERLLARSPLGLSGGERQRVGLARALAPRPRLLLCDEPVSALDFPSRFLVLDRLRAVQRIERIPLLFVTHSPAEAVCVGDRVLALANGGIEVEGTPLEVLTSPAVGHGTWTEPVRNLVTGRVAGRRNGETELLLDREPRLTLVVPPVIAEVGATVRVLVRSDDILLARGSPTAFHGQVSARNVLSGRVQRILHHDGAAEVEVGTGAVAWTVSILDSTVSMLALEPGAEVLLIIKARSCVVLDSAGAS